MQPEIRRSVKSMTEYVVRFSELKEDKETFEFVLGDSFFKVFQSSEWENGRITAIVLVQKRHDGITIDIELNGDVKVYCDRCLDVFSYRIETSDRLFVKYGQADEEIDDNVVIVSRDDNQIDLSHFLFEYLVLSLPITKAHPENEDGSSDCDVKMMERLSSHIVSEETENIDPRWDDLKKLFDKN